LAGYEESRARDMVHRTYQGLGAREAAVREFEALRAHVRWLWGLQAAVGLFSADGSALDVAIDAAQTSAYHFTRRPHFYGLRDPDPGAPNLRDRGLAPMAFEALRPYAQQLRRLQGRCRPFGRDWQAINVAFEGLETAAFHFTAVDRFYGSRGDSAGPVRIGGGVA
jgi:hypothetical protein